MERIRSETRNALILQYALLFLAVFSLATLACAAAENGIFGEEAFRVEDVGALHDAVSCIRTGILCVVIYSIYISHFFRGKFKTAVNILLVSVFSDAAWRILLSIDLFYYYNSTSAEVFIFGLLMLAIAIIEELVALTGLNFIMHGFGNVLDTIGEKKLASGARLLGNLCLVIVGTLFMLLTEFDHPFLSYAWLFIRACCELLMFSIVRKSNRLIYQSYMNGVRHKL